MSGSRVLELKRDRALLERLADRLPTGALIDPTLTKEES